MKKKKVTFYNSGTNKFPCYLIMCDGKEYCQTGSKETAKEIVKLLKTGNHV